MHIKAAWLCYCVVHYCILDLSPGRRGLFSSQVPKAREEDLTSWDGGVVYVDYGWYILGCGVKDEGVMGGFVGDGEY